MGGCPGLGFVFSLLPSVWPAQTHHLKITNNAFSLYINLLTNPTNPSHQPNHHHNRLPTQPSLITSLLHHCTTITTHHPYLYYIPPPPSPVGLPLLRPRGCFLLSLLCSGLSAPHQHFAHLRYLLIHHYSLTKTISNSLYTHHNITKKNSNIQPTNMPSSHQPTLPTSVLSINGILSILHLFTMLLTSKSQTHSCTTIAQTCTSRNPTLCPPPFP